MVITAGHTHCEFHDDQSFMEYAAVGILKTHVFNAVAERACDLYSIKGEELKNTLSASAFKTAVRRVKLLEAGREALCKGLLKPDKESEQEQLRMLREVFEELDTSKDGRCSLPRSLPRLRSRPP